MHPQIAHYSVRVCIVDPIMLATSASKQTYCDPESISALVSSPALPADGQQSTHNSMYPSFVYRTHNRRL